MRFVFILFLGVFLFAKTTKITNIDNDTITVLDNVKKGTSGVVLCPYENREIICARAVLFGKTGKLKVYDNLANSSFALPVVKPKKGDKIILGKDYNRILIIAPNQNSYVNIKEKLKNKTVISSDMLAAFLDGIPTREDFINFAKKMDIGIYIFVLDKIYVVDAYSFYAINSFDYKKVEYKKPFFMTYNNINLQSGLFKYMFKSKIKNFEKYYKSLIKE